MRLRSLLSLPWIMGMVLRRGYWRSRLKSLGARAKIYRFVRIYVPGRVTVGKDVAINDFVHIWGGGGVSIGDNTLIAAHTVITSQTHDATALFSGKLYRDTSHAEAVRIGNNVWIGSNVVILPGVEIGDDSIVAAGAVVTKSVPSQTLVAGVPARVVRALEKPADAHRTSGGSSVASPRLAP